MDGMQSVCLSSSQPCTDSIQIMNSDTEKTVLTSGKQSRSATTPTAAALQLKQTSGERGRQPGLGVLCPRIDLQPFVECFAPEPASPPFNESSVHVHSDSEDRTVPSHGWACLLTRICACLTTLSMSALGMHRVPSNSVSVLGELVVWTTFKELGIEY